MGNITWNSILAGVYGFIIFIMALCIVAWLIVEKGRINAQRAKEYDDLYERIQKALTWTASGSTYYFVFIMFDKLQKLKYKDEEKTEVLKNEIYKKYKKISQEIH